MLVRIAARVRVSASGRGKREVCASRLLRVLPPARRIVFLEGRFMRKIHLGSLAVCAAIVGGFGGSTNAAVLINDNFEGYANQAAYEAAWTPTTAGQSTTWTTDQASSPTHSISAPAVAGFRNERNFGENAANAFQQIVWSFRFYDSASTANNYRQYSEMINGAGTGTADIVAMGLNNTLTVPNGANFYQARLTSVDGGAGSSLFFPLNGAGAPTRSVGWHELKAIVGLTSVEFFVDGVSAKTVALAAAGQGKSYERIRIGSNISSPSGIAYFDDQFLSVVPEPTTLAALGAAGLVFGRRRRA